MQVDLTYEELMFLRGCYEDSYSEGHFDRSFEAVPDLGRTAMSLTAKGVFGPTNVPVEERYRPYGKKASG